MKRFKIKNLPMFVTGIFLLILAVLIVINSYYTIFWRHYLYESLSFKYPVQFYKKTITDQSTSFCSVKNIHEMNDCISLRLITGKFDRGNISTLGGVLGEEYIDDKVIGGKQFVVYSDGDAGYRADYYIYEQPGKDRYIKFTFMTNVYSGWNAGRDVEKILSSLKLND